MRLLALLPLLAFAQASEIRVSSRLDPAVVKLGDAAILRVTVTGTVDARLDPPAEVKGLRILPLGGPQRSSSFYSDGVRTVQSVTLVFSYRVVPEGEGTFEIPPMHGTAEGKRFETRAHRLEVIRDFRGADSAFVEVELPKRAVFRGEVFRIVATFGIRRDLVEAGSARGPVLRAPWAEDLPDAVRLENPPPARTEAQEIVLNGRQGFVERIGEVRRGEQPFVAWRLSVPFVGSHPGTIAVGSTFFAFELVTRWGRDAFFGQRTVSDSERMFVDAAEGEVRVEALPEAGRPEGFGGAIGAFRVQAEATPRDLRVGESIRYTLTVAGEGNVEFFEAPDLERTPGFERFRFFGKVESKEPGRRQIVYDLAPSAEDAAAIPAIRFPYFDPEARAYRVAESEAIPLRVRPIPAGERLPDLPGARETEVAPKDDLRDAKPVFSSVPDAGTGGAAVALAALAPPLAWAGALVLRGRARRREADPVAWRRSRAARSFAQATAPLRARFESGDARGAFEGLAKAIAAYLADRTGTTAEAVRGTDAEARLRDAGAGDELAREFGAILESCDRGVFAGGLGVAEGRALLDRAGAAVRRLEKGGRG